MSVMTVSVTDPHASLLERELPLPSTRYHSLDFWRGVACLIVVAHHSEMYLTASDSVPSPWNIANAVFRRLWIGVPLFFVISGYCISATADKERRRPAGTSNYFKKRFHRIFPPYWAALALALLIFAIFPAMLSFNQYGVPGFVAPTAMSPRAWIGNITLTETWLNATTPFLGPAWTLCYEEQFYAITGLLLLMPRWFFRGAVGITAITFFCRATHLQTTGLFLDGQWLEFGAGMAVYYALNRGSRKSRIFIGLLLAVGVLWWSRHPKDLLGAGTNEFHLSMVVACVFALLLLAKTWDVPFSRSKLVAPIASCGVRCYSIYLVHWPIVKLLTSWAVVAGLTGARITFFVIIPVSLASSLGAGWLFYYSIERRFLNAPRYRIPADLPELPV
jgi:peptidoglycan/LPS O-acetylase OafA/YrhL